MSNVAKLKKQAAEFEQKRQFDKALAVYVKLLDSFDEHADELDVALFNRVGDLMLRQGNTADAVDYYEKAVDKYADTGFFNNAIALCNKILRHAPGRASIYYKLGKISAHKGFKTEAKANFLEYADRMQKAGKVQEAFRALKEFADLVPDQDEIRLTLADQLTKADRKREAVEQLQILHARYDAEGRNLDANAMADRIRTLDPTAAIKSEGLSAAKASGSELIFLDLDAPTTRTGPAGIPKQPAFSRPAAPPKPAVAPPPRATPPTPPPPAVTPPSTTPIGITPVGSTPVGSTPVENTPIGNTPIGNTPVSNTPLGGTPIGVTPVGTTPVGSTPIGSTPIGSTPVGSTPIGVTPIGSTPIGTTPIGTTPVNATPVNATPVNSTPTSSDLADLDFLETPFTRADVAIEGAPPDSMESPLSGITRVGDNMPRPTETPTSALPGLESTSLAEPDIIKSTPTNSLLDIEPTSLVQESPPVDRSAAPTHWPERPTPYGGSVGGSLDFIVPPQTPPRSQSVTPIDFDSEDLVPTPMDPRPRSPTPLNRSPLDGLPLMDLDVPSEKTPVAPIAREVQSLDEIAGSTDLELIDPGVDDAVDLNAEGLTTDDDTIGMPTPSVARRSTMVAAHNVELLQASVDADTENAGLRRELAEAMFEAGDRNGGIRELENAMSVAEHAGDLEFASTVAEEIARLEPDSVKHHQKRVEYAYRTNDRPRLIEAYLALGDALLRVDQIDKARSIYQRILDLAPDEARARAALDTIVVPEPEPAPPPPRGSMMGRRHTGSTRVVNEPERPAPPADSFVNLGDWLRDDHGPRDTRMVVAEQEPTGDEDADFADMLRKFKQGVAENVDPEDYQSHYDLAIAYKEMGLLDEAIAEFQKALGATTNRLPTFESLGQCFLEKGQPKLAASILGRALNERGTEEQLVGVLYLLGRAAEEQGNAAEALVYYQRVFVQDIQFRDIAERMSEVERAAR